MKKIWGNQAINNGLWLYALQIFNTIIPLLTVPYITRILGATEYGFFSIAFNLIGYLQVVVEYGFGMSGARKASLAKTIEELNPTFSSIILSRIMLSVACAILTVVYGIIFFDSEKQMVCTVLLFLLPIGTILQQTWLFQGLQRMQYITISSVLARIISLICVFSFVKTANDLYIYCIAYSITTLLIGIIGTVLAIKVIGVRFVHVSFKRVIEEIKSGWYVFTTSLSSKIFSAFGVTVLGIMTTEHEVGVYSAIFKIPQIVMLAWTPVGQVLYPISSKKLTTSYLNGRKYVKKISCFILPCFGALVLGISIGAKRIINLLFGGEYATYYYIAYPLMLWILFGIVNNLLGIQTLLAGGYSKEYSKCFGVGVITTIVMNLLLIWLWGVVGAAISPVISEFVLCILLIGEIRKVDKKNKKVV